MWGVGQYLSSRHMCSWGYWFWDFTLFLFHHTYTLMSLPQSLLHSSSLSLLSTPRDPKFNYCQAAVGGRLSCTGTAERNSDTQHVKQMHHGSDFTAGRQCYGTDRKHSGGWNAAISVFNYRWSMAENNVRKEELSKPYRRWEQRRWSQSTWSKIRHYRIRIIPWYHTASRGLTC